MLNICTHCKGIFAGPLSVVLVSEKDSTQVYSRKCPNCGAQYRITVERVEGPKVSGEDLDKITNKPT